jgi:CheY-like chemotaxis protein
MSGKNQIHTRSAEHTYTVLVVDDDPLNVKVLQKFLEKRGGFNVIHEENVAQILSICHHEPIDLVIMDVSLHRSAYYGTLVDGFEITRLLKQDAETKHIPILVTTAHDLSAEVRQTLETCGADGYFKKPITDYHQFIDTIIQTIRISRKRGDS